MMFIIGVIAVILVTIGLVKLIDKFIPSKLRPVLMLVLWIGIFALGYLTFMSIYNPILFNQEKEKRYAEVIKSLEDIREAQLAHKTVTGKFEGNWDNLVKFIDTAEFTLTQRRDSSIIDKEANKRFGLTTMTKDVVIIDTLGTRSVKDSIFKNSDRYKTMMNVPVGEAGAKFKLQAGYLEQNDINIPVFEASVKKDIILFDQPKELVMQENQVLSVEAVNGDEIKVGSMDEIKTIGNWPKTYGTKKD
ncbi:hypothetical protein ACKGJY_00380 [Hyunsoonleella sp. 2307UL5-6]|uniref:hypothetical protein n=1 Tax=Hyunsoonleella sp. 2307UL5-6 TaxID=3384768 RepID=UPI0039BCC541